MRYLIGLLVIIAVMIFIIIRLLAGGGSEPQHLQNDLAAYATTSTVVRMTIDNPIQAPETHREVQITVGRDTADFTLFRGYERDVMEHKTYPMSVTAFRAFLQALKFSGKYTEGNDDPSLKDETGYCALGNRYVFEIIDENGKVLQHYWDTTCGVKTFRGDADTVEELFTTQIPDYDTLIGDVEL